ncbi:hypothetical protein ON010_g8293 [Phytophthora cinnamomi]|nr:hypothetical protein ON010_g8293 [Phytophthora cinnamomi]
MTSSTTLTSQLRRQYSAVSSCSPPQEWRRREAHGGRSTNPEDQDCAFARPRVRLLYSDEDQRSRYCANAQHLLDTVLQGADTNSSNSQIARKSLRYRRLIGRLGDVDPSDPAFDVSAFFGVEWRKATPQRAAAL